MSIKKKKLLTDIIVAIDSIDEHLEKRRNFEEYKANKTKRRAVERELKINPEITISYARLITDLRNKIIHAYDNVNDTIIWKIIMKDIPVLKQQAEQLLTDK